MRHPGLWALVGLLVSTAHLFAQAASPFAMPTPVGGPIVHPDGRIMNGMDFAPTNPWSGGLELGLNGSEGNSQTLKLRLGGDIKYDTTDDVVIGYGWYGLSRQRGALSENKALLTLRNELMYDDTFAYFTQGQLEYDEFRLVDFRLGIHNGLSIVALKDSSSLVKVRLGFGASREYGGPTDGWLPEGIFGGDYEWTITAKTKFTLGADYYPDITDWGHYRIRARGSFDFLLDQQLNLWLRLGMMDRYDSRPGIGTKYNDLDYFATILFRF
ncbi:DUF481 domain-containing protein [Zavarzinella formosa]|uniref:DUF481 domain-containing protein n=1 Tax=Zavarzinella formosa TaxID=360055 RepID=UPI000310915F|nr:DUF481 domain-containing protein [Zavarzinella formosa]